MTELKSTSPAYKLSQVCLKLDQNVILQDLSFDVHWGEKVALLGSSGAGKSSLLKLLNGALKPTQGELQIMGRSRHQLSPKQLRFLQRQIGTIYQQFHLIQDLRVIHNVNAGHLARWPAWKALFSLVYPLGLEQAQAALSQVGMAEETFSPTSQLSGGQQQRVAIARVLIQNPLIVLADEPVASLDPRLSDEIMELLTALLTQQPRMFIASLHDVTLARRYCDRILGLKNGRLMFDLPSSEVSDEQLRLLYQEDKDNAM